jgi:rare lipoprotein A
MSRQGSTIVIVLLFLFGLTGCHLFGGHEVQKGYACWYGPEYHGKPTASGEIFDQEASSAAHRSLPFGSIVLVKNLQNGKSVKVRVNDRGPWQRGRIIDLSKAAAREIGMLAAGVVPVRIEVLRKGRGH